MKSKDVMKVATICASALTVAYFVAFAVVTGLEKRWLACGFSCAAAVVTLLWTITNALSSVASRRLLRQRRRVQMKVIELPSQQYSQQQRQQHMSHNATHATAAANPDNDAKRLSDTDPASPFQLTHPGTLTFPRREDTDGHEEEMEDGTDDIEESLLSSIRTSMTTQLDRADGPEGSFTAPAGSSRVALASARQMNPLHLGASPVDNADGEVNTFILSPPSSMAYKNSRVVHTEKEKQTVVNNHSLSFTGHAFATTSGASLEPPPASAQRGSLVVSGGTTDRRTSSYPVVMEAEGIDGCLLNVIPAVTIYTTVVTVLVMWGASFAGAWDTHCTFAALPALACPAMWGSLSALRVFYLANAKAWMRDFHLSCLDVILHWATVIVMCVLSGGTFIAAFTLELVYRETYVVNGDHHMPTSVIAVSFLAPIPFFALTCTGCLSAALQRISTSNVTERFGIEHRSQGSKQNNLRAQVNGAGEAGSTQPLKRGSTAPRDFNVTNAFGSDDDMSSISMDDTMATLSSIVRSSIASGANSTLVSPMHFSVSRSLLLRGASQHNNASGSVNSSLPGAPAGRQLGFAVGSMPQLKTITMLYIAYKDIFANASRGGALGLNRGGPSAAAHARSAQHMIAANFDALNEALEDTRDSSSNDSNAYILTAFEDALCLVWGLLPFSSDPVQLAVEKAQQVFKSFYDRPKPASAAGSQLELVAAIVYAPHSLVGMVGNNGLKAVHFFNPGQHTMGAELLNRGVTMYRTLPSITQPSAGTEGTFTGILMDSRSAHSAASTILARPCGVICEESGEVATKAPQTTKTAAGKSSTLKYTCMYDFLSFVNAKEEEWHLVVQRQEKLGQQFHFLTEATQNLQRNNVSDAHVILKKTVAENKANKPDDNHSIAQLMLDDLEQLGAP